MTTLAPERTDDPVTNLRRGFDLDDLENPAGALFSDRYREYEITMTGGNPFTVNYQTNISHQDWDCPLEPCCMI